MTVTYFLAHYRDLRSSQVKSPVWAKRFALGSMGFMVAGVGAWFTGAFWLAVMPLLPLAFLLFIVALHIRRKNRALTRFVPLASEQAMTLDVDLELYTRLKDWLAEHHCLASMRVRTLKDGLKTSIEQNEPKRFPGEKYLFLVLGLYLSAAVTFIVSKISVLSERELMLAFATLAFTLIHIAATHWFYLRTYLPLRITNRELAIEALPRLEEILMNSPDSTGMHPA
ncbi:MAG: hypothetical protein AAFV36_03960 [Myxococcota bacterium]